MSAAPIGVDIDADEDAASLSRLYRYFNKIAEANNLVKPLSEAEYQSPIWVDRYSQTQPAWIAHKNFGPCLIYAKRTEPTTFLGVGRTYYLVSLITAVEDKALEETRRGYYQAPSVVSIEVDGDAQLMPFVLPMACIITRFILTNPQESSMVTVYDGNEYTTMMLSELRRRAGKPNNEKEFSLAFDMFKQSNPVFMLKHDISAATVATPAAEARLIMSSLSHHDRARDHKLRMRYALAPAPLREALVENEVCKGSEYIDARCAYPMHDPHGVISHLRRK